MAQRTETSSRREYHGVRAPRLTWWIPVVVVVAAVALFGVSSLVSTSPHTVDHLTLVNDTGYNIEVGVAGTTGAGSLPLGTAPARATIELRNVTDHGPTWIFHFDAQGEDGGELRISRTDLVAANWRVEIPATVAARLRGAGAPPSPVPGS
jgi:hypothetical protein